MVLHMLLFVVQTFVAGHMWVWGLSVAQMPVVVGHAPHKVGNKTAAGHTPIESEQALIALGQMSAGFAYMPVEAEHMSAGAAHTLAVGHMFVVAEFGSAHFDNTVSLPRVGLPAGVGMGVQHFECVRVLRYFEMTETPHSDFVGAPHSEVFGVHYEMVGALVGELGPFGRLAERLGGLAGLPSASRLAIAGSVQAWLHLH